MNRAANNSNGSLAGMVYLASVCNQHKVSEKYRNVIVNRINTGFWRSPHRGIVIKAPPSPKIKNSAPSASNTYLITTGILPGKCAENHILNVLMKQLRRYSIG